MCVSGVRETVCLWQIVCYRSKIVQAAAAAATTKIKRIKVEIHWRIYFIFFPVFMNYNHWSVSLGRFIARQRARAGKKRGKYPGPILSSSLFSFIPFNIFIDMAMCSHSPALSHSLFFFCTLANQTIGNPPSDIEAMVFTPLVI